MKVLVTVFVTVTVMTTFGLTESNFCGNGK